MTVRVAILDDTQSVAATIVDWSRLASAGAQIEIFGAPFAGEEDAAGKLAPFDVLVPMRERTPLPASLINRLERLKFIALTGARAPTLDISACTARGIVVSNTGGGENVTAAASELTWALILAASRALGEASALMRSGGWHAGLALGEQLEGRRLGLLGLGKLGQRVARYGAAFGMEVVAWSQNLDPALALQHNARAVSKAELFETSDIVSLHLVLSARTRGVVGRSEISALRPGALIVNTSRGALIEEKALVEALQSGRVRAALDVFDEEPLGQESPLRSCPNVLLTPHLGYSTRSVFERFYQDSIDNILAWRAGSPIRMLNPEALALSRQPAAQGANR